VNDKKFNNNYLAYYESYKSGKPITFHVHEEQYDLLDWKTEPTESFELLMDIHAHRLRQKYNYLILNWSGGTDSQTIYNVFKRNNIHIDEICVKYSTAESCFFPESNALWLKENHWDATTKITIINDQDSSRREVVLNNEDWLFNNTGDFRRFGTCGIDMGDIRIANDLHSGMNWGIIIGLEKPEVVFINNKWYATMPDSSIRGLPGYDDNVETFFLEPKIHLKQCHMLKNFLKLQNIIHSSNPYGYKDPRNMADRYYVTSKAVGRHDELNPGISLGQKQKNGRNIRRTIINTDVNLKDFLTPDDFLRDKLKDGAQTALTYVKGFYNLRQEKHFWEYLNYNHFNIKDAVFSVKAINSKYYYLGD
jgi:hypothetical protein